MMIRDAFNYSHVVNQAIQSLRMACLATVALGLIGIVAQLAVTD